MKRAANAAPPVPRWSRAVELLAAGGACALLVNPAAAVELGDLQVESALGQPLRASIAFALGPNERLQEACVYLNAAAPTEGLPVVTRASATLLGERIVLRGATPLREPMLSLQVVVDCPYTAHLRRDYLLLLNPPGMATAARAAAPAALPSSAAAAASRPAATPARRGGAVRRRAAAERTPVAADTDYRVQPGDTLSGIAARISDRELGVWPASEAIFAANPAAFIDGDMDRLIAGATLRIPQSVTGAAAPATTGASPTASGYRAYRNAADGAVASNDAAIEQRPAPRIEDANPDAAARPDGAATVDSQPAARTALPESPLESATAGAADPVAAPPAAERVQPAAEPAPRRQPPVGLPDTAIAAQTPRGEPIPLSADPDSPGQSWLVWLGGGGIAIFLALLIFGRRLREGFGGAAPAARQDSDETAVNEALQGRRSTDRRQAGASDAADSDDTNFDTGDDMDTPLDFSFAASGQSGGELDFIVEESQITEFPPRDLGEDTQVTREMPARKAQTATGDDPDSITDRHARPAEAFASADDVPSPASRPRQPETIEVEALDSRPRMNSGLDLTTEFDYGVLEQDYEEELSATQALNMEIEEAARELQHKLGEFDEDTSRNSMAEDLDGTAEMTAEMPTELVPTSAAAGNQAQNDAADTDLNEALTSRLPQSDETVEMDPDATVEHRSKTGSA